MNSDGRIIKELEHMVHSRDVEIQDLLEYIAMLENKLYGKNINGVK